MGQSGQALVSLWLTHNLTACFSSLPKSFLLPVRAGRAVSPHRQTEAIFACLLSSPAAGEHTVNATKGALPFPQRPKKENQVTAGLVIKCNNNSLYTAVDFLSLLCQFKYVTLRSFCVQFSCVLRVSTCGKEF